MYKPLMPVFVDEVCFICCTGLIAFTEETGGYNYVCENGHSNLLPVKNKTVHYIDALFYSSNSVNLPVPKLSAQHPVCAPFTAAYTIQFPMCNIVWYYALEKDRDIEYEKIVAELRQLGLHK